MTIEEMLSEEDLAWAGDVSGRIQEKMSRVTERTRGKIPYTTGPDGSYDDRSRMDPGEKDWGNGLAWWTNGFWPGILWQLYHACKDRRYEQAARETEEKMDACFLHFYGLHHDVGFMWMPMAVADYRLTGSEDAKRRGLLAAQLLAGRYNPAGRFIRAWNEVGEEDTRGWAIIDCMFNISLLYWASEETGDPRFKEIAMNHADTVMEHFIRPDGSSCHIVEFDPFQGGVVRTYGGQGYADGSAWTRGQAWALYGFSISFRHTGRQEYLETAQRVADYFVAHTPPSGIIPVDFCQPPSPAWEDSCGACAAAGGLIELAQLTKDRTKAVQYMACALRILRAIDRDRSCWDDTCDAIVKNCSGSYHGGPHHITMVYADYFFIEAIFKLTGEGFFIW